MGRMVFVFFFQAEDGIRDWSVTGVQTCALPISDWRPVPKPTVLWFNTGVLILSSAALQWAQEAAARRDMAGMRTALMAAGATVFAFLIGQLLAWQQLNAGGYY